MSELIGDMPQSDGKEEDEYIRDSPIVSSDARKRKTLKSFIDAIYYATNNIQG